MQWTGHCLLLHLLPNQTKIKEMKGKRFMVKGPIHIRTKKLKDGRESIYLDCYRKGVRTYEFLRLYLLQGKDAETRATNVRTMAAARAIQIRRTIEILNNKAANEDGTDMLLTELIEKYRKDLERRKARGGDNILSLLKVVKTYRGDRVTLRMIDREYIVGLINFLRDEYTTKTGKHIKPHTAQGYCGLLSAALNMAVRNGTIKHNPFKQISPVDKIHATESQRAYLTLDELRAMSRADCKHEVVKRAYLFSCYCGLRLSDIRALTWGKLTCDGGRWRTTIVMKKTGAPLYLPLNEHALRCLPKCKGADGMALVFDRLPTITTIETTLQKWATNAGVTKHITFHTARHTFATLMLTLGADLYTTSKLLGHSNISTTTIYARIVDKKKDEAVRLVDEALP